MNIEDLKNYTITKKSEVDLARDKITGDIYTKLLDSLGFYDIYYLGCVSTIEMLLKWFRSDGDIIQKKDLIDILNEYKTLDVSDNVKNLIDKVLKENGR